MNSVLLEDRAVIVVSGEEAGAFLGRILTNDVSGLVQGEGRYAALLTPQGKVIADMLVGFWNAPFGNGVPQYPGGYLLVLPRSVAPIIESRLKLLKLRSKLEVASFVETSQQYEKLGIVAHFSKTSAVRPRAINQPAAFFRFATGVATLGFEVINFHDGEAVSFDEDEEFHAHRISLGIPYGGLDFAYGEVFPHEINMDRLNGIDFKKGCYVGQEIVSRMEHRGTARTRIMKIAFVGAAPVLGTPVMAGEKVIGSTGYAVAARGLATIRLDKLADALAAGEAIHAGGVPVTISAPPYAPDFMPGASVPVTGA
jgi:tRNA-modifying protein YgfZ